MGRAPWPPVVPAGATARAQFAVAMGDLARTMDDLAKGVTSDSDSDPLQIVDVQDTTE